MGRRRPARTKAGMKNRREIAYRKRLISRRAKTMKVRVVTRKEQPSPRRGVVTTIRSSHRNVLIVSVQEVQALKKGDIAGPVSSS